jgi:hypothetical protein
MARTPVRLAAAAVMASVVVLIACDATVPSPTPTATPGGTPAPVTAAPSPPLVTGSPTPARPTVSPSPTPSPAPTATPTVTASPAVPTSPSPTLNGAAWRYLGDFPVDEAIDVSSVASTRDGFIAVGSEPAEGEPFFGVRQGVVWTSADGISWQRSTDEAFASSTLLHVVAVGGTPYVFGLRSVCVLAADDCVDLPDAGMTVWRPDDDGWERLPQAAAMQEAFLVGVVALDDTTIVGFGDRPGGRRGELVATAWVTDDGVEWEEVTDLAGLDPISAAAVGPDGMVAFGTRFMRGTDRIVTVAAFSEDGRNFEPATVPAGLEVVIESIALGESGFVAAGATEDAQFLGAKPTLLTSADGRAWTEIELDDSFAGIGLHQVRALPGGYLLLGYRPSEADPTRDSGISWLSRDGSEWTQPASLGGGDYRLFNGSAVGPTGAVAFALDYEEEPTEGPLSTVRAWFAPIDELRPR